jgi:hypothetical protein
MGFAIGFGLGFAACYFRSYLVLFGQWVWARVWGD